MRVLRVSHSAVVDAWRERERAVARRGVEVRLLSAAAWDEGGSRVRIGPAFRRAGGGASAPSVRTRPCSSTTPGRSGGRSAHEWDVLDIHEEPFALATAEVLLLRRAAPAADALCRLLRAEPRQAAPRSVPVAAAAGPAAAPPAVSVCSTAAGDIVRRRGFPGRPDVVPLGVESPQTSPRRAPGPGPDHRVCGSARRPQGRRRAPRGRGRPERHGARGRGSGSGTRPRCATARRGRTWPDASASSVRSRASRSPRSTRASTCSRCRRARPPAWVEQFGRVAVEAMAHGVPVVASDSGALPDVVGDAGLLRSARTTPSPCAKAL